jgi:Sulfotransferase family
VSERVQLTPQLTAEDLTAENIMVAATQAAGCDDFGEMDFLQGLEIYLDDLQRFAGLSPKGIQSQFQDMARMLANRLGYVRDVKAHPEILEEEIERPIVMLGLPRTGSSKLQRMIAADPAMQRLEVWRLLFPAPFPGTAGVHPDPRIAMAEQIEAMLKEHFPAQVAGHPMEAREPDEELWLLEMTFRSHMSSHKIYAPNHGKWVASQTQLQPYRYMRKMLQYLQWQDGGGRGRPWVMKSPMNVGEIATILEVFPDATLVHTHRDPKVVMASYAALLEATWLAAMETVDLTALGKFICNFWQQQMGRNLADRRQLGEDRIIDAYYDDICNRADNVIAEIYRAAGRKITPQASEAFHRYEANRPAGYFGKHHYSLERYNLDPEEVDELFSDYYRHFPRLK